jgi:hypothetical protein
LKREKHKQYAKQSPRRDAAGLKLDTHKQKLIGYPIAMAAVNSQPAATIPGNAPGYRVGHAPGAYRTTIHTQNPGSMIIRTGR